MASLYGRLQGSRGEATRIGHQSIKAKLETWEGSIEVLLSKDGMFSVMIGDKSYPRTLVATGNVNDRTYEAAPTEDEIAAYQSTHRECGPDCCITGDTCPPLRAQMM